MTATDSALDYDPDLTEREMAMPAGLAPEDELRRLSLMLDKALRFARTAAQEYAEAENAYRLARASHMMAARQQGDHVKTADERSAYVDTQTGDERYRAHLADDMRKVASQAVKARTAQLSAFQTLMNSKRAERESEWTSSTPGRSPGAPSGWG